MRTSAWKHFSALAFTKRCHFAARGVASLISSNYPLAYVVSRESMISMNIDSDIFSRYLWRVQMKGSGARIQCRFIPSLPEMRFGSRWSDPHSTQNVKLL